LHAELIVIDKLLKETTAKLFIFANTYSHVIFKEDMNIIAMKFNNMIKFKDRLQIKTLFIFSFYTLFFMS